MKSQSRDLTLGHLLMSVKRSTPGFTRTLFDFGFSGPPMQEEEVGELSSGGALPWARAGLLEVPMERATREKALRGFPSGDMWTRPNDSLKNNRSSCYVLNACSVPGTRRARPPRGRFGACRAAQGLGWA